MIFGRSCFLLLVLSAPVQAVLLDPPGGNKRTELLRQELRATYLEKKDTYVVRSRHVDDSGVPKYTNRLVNEDSCPQAVLRVRGMGTGDIARR